MNFGGYPPVEGLIYASGRKNAIVRYPLVIPYSAAEERNPPEMPTFPPTDFPRDIEVATEVAHNDVIDMRWTQDPVSGRTAFDQVDERITATTNVAGWAYSRSKLRPNPPPLINGTNGKIDSRDAAWNVFAGVLFGTGAATAVDSLKNFVAWLSKRSRRRTGRLTRVWTMVRTRNFWGRIAFGTHWNCPACAAHTGPKARAST